VTDEELAAVIAAAAALLATHEKTAPPALSRWRLADRIGTEAARTYSAGRSRWAEAGRAR
jgi:hypothetical protein